MVDAYRFQFDIQLLGHEGRERGLNSLPHFGSRYDDRYALVVDTDIWREC